MVRNAGKGELTATVNLVNGKCGVPLCTTDMLAPTWIIKSVAAHTVNLWLLCAHGTQAIKNCGTSRQQSSKALGIK